MLRFYGIYNLKTERLESAYGTHTVPALYPTFGMAYGILKRRNKERRGAYTESHEVREVELTIK